MDAPRKVCNYDKILLLDILTNKLNREKYTLHVFNMCLFTFQYYCALNVIYF